MDFEGYYVLIRNQEFRSGMSLVSNAKSEIQHALRCQSRNAAVRVLVATSSLAANALPVHLRTEHMTNPLGIDVATPVFEWQSNSLTPIWMQSGIRSDSGNRRRELAERQDGYMGFGPRRRLDSINIAYGGPALQPQQRYFWRVKTWDSKCVSTVSAPAWFETGLLSSSDWKAQWIRRDDPAANKELADVRWLWLAGADPHKPAFGNVRGISITC